jgi:hypothetical protein
MRGMWWVRWLAAVLLATTAATAQFDRPGPAGFASDVEYDGRVAFVRLAWQAAGGRYGGGWNSAWNHDYPRAEQHLAQIVRELTLLDLRDDGSRVLTLDDPRLFKHPIAYMWEPGYWTLTDTEAHAFRDYLRKGGFAVFEDFDGPAQWANFEAQMRRVLPEGKWVPIPNGDRIFDAFFRIENVEAIVHPMSGQRPSYLGIYEHNDPARRLMAVANFDNDIPEYWEWSGEGLFPFDSSNDAYKLGVNYFVYGMTH